MILLLGYGVSNQSVEKILIKENKKYIVFDGFVNDINESVLDGVTLIIRSPGISISHPLIMLAYKKSIEIISEIEFAYRINSKGKIIALTGSNGKTSTLTYTYQILKHYYKDIYLVGNSGIPYSSIVDKVNEDTIILLELSNFQLENIYSLSPYISIILNISENHLDKVANYDEYVKSKLKITNNSQNLILFKDDDLLNNIKHKNITYISECKNRDYYLKDLDIYRGYKKYISLETTNLYGKHNLINLMFAISICNKLGINKTLINKVLPSIEGVKYRLEFIKEIGGVKIFNDGKSTTPYSVEAAINAFPHKNIHLIIGGKNKNLDFNFLNKYENIKFYAYGEAKEDLSATLGAKTYENFKEAYKNINAKKGEVIIYSPGCASYDQFKDYVERSKAFEDLILNT